MISRLPVLLCVVLLSPLAIAQPVEQPAPSTQPAFKSLDEVVQLIPEGVTPRPGAEWNNVKVRVVQDALNKALGRKFKLSASIRSVRRDNNETSLLQLDPTDTGPCPASFLGRFPDIDLLTLARMNEGDRVVVEGMITKVVLVPRGEKGMSLQFELDPAHLLGPAVRAAAGAGAAKKPGDPFNGPDEVVGVVDAGVVPARDADWTADKYRTANAALSQKTIGKQLAIQVKVHWLAHDDQQRIVMWAEEMGRDAYLIKALFVFAPNEDDAARQLKVGDSVTLQGRIEQSEVNEKHDDVKTWAELYLRMSETKVVPDAPAQ